MSETMRALVMYEPGGPEVLQVRDVANSAHGIAVIPSSGRIYTKIFPPYALLIESYQKAQEVATNHEQLD
ncbi:MULTISPECIES: hypothetical protein [Sinorhizobium]|uniref:hypothetical protein n=1 Tax=unclassified Sinorhizobium TaxID=2613772 RepID=UPI002949C071|nr:hypothetical protein KGO5_03795 [Sinorhizobium sp. KGO-5]